METKAILRGVRLSEQKGRLVADLVRGKSVEQALKAATVIITPRIRMVIFNPCCRLVYGRADRLSRTKPYRAFCGPGATFFGQ